MSSVMIVEDDAATAAFLADNLAADGFSVACASAPGEALRAIEFRHPDLIVLDVMLDGGSGLEVLDRVRSADTATAKLDPDVPVLVLSGRGSEVERVRGFARGADDYVVKPFSYPELFGRLQAVLRRSRGAPLRGLLVIGDLVIDPAARSVTLGGESV